MFKGSDFIISAKGGQHICVYIVFEHKSTICPSVSTMCYQEAQCVIVRNYPIYRAVVTN